MDAGYWHPRFDVLNALFERVESVAIGDLDTFITYGVIASGERPEPITRGVVRVDPAGFAPTGLNLSKCMVVPKGSTWDAANRRAEQGDLLFVRSGIASVGRCAVYDRRRVAVVGCFVNIIRQSKLCPYYLCAFLHSRPGRLQIERVVNGVGTLNISFDEIRALRVVLLDQASRDSVSTDWRAASDAHRSGMKGKAGELQARAIARFDGLLQ